MVHLGKMADQLARWQSRAEYESVFGFFSFVLVDGGRQKFRDRLGRAVDESLDHFLNLAQNFALGGGVSLLEFLTSNPQQRRRGQARYGRIRYG